ncbi:hypothetical protein ALC57_11946 [Trachymyrmex cornetzi]|uniref:Ig-like domain-containing protein n=1 Tax=Trachymyrmex cornetzi TaxID=471704 RepID=A0A195DSH0_9HYME|nr:hypothetical protein ALC57_11946 [Trachymyrmex cornetzi]
MELRARQETPRVSSRLFLRSLLEVRHYSNDTLVSLPSRSLPPFLLIAPFSWAAPDGAPPFLSGRLGCFASARVTRNGLEEIVELATNSELSLRDESRIIEKGTDSPNRSYIKLLERQFHSRTNFLSSKNIVPIALASNNHCDNCIDNCLLIAGDLISNGETARATKKTITITIINNNNNYNIYYISDSSSAAFRFDSIGRLASRVRGKGQWEKDQIIGSYLEIGDVTLEDYGEYKCEVSNGVDEEMTLAAHVYRQEPQFVLSLPNGSWRKSLLLAVLVLVLLLSAGAFYARCWLPLALFCRDKFGRLEESAARAPWESTPRRSHFKIPLQFSSPCFPNCVVSGSYVLQIERGEFFMELLILKVHETREDNLVAEKTQWPLFRGYGKECDALVCYHEKDSSLVIGIVIPTLESRHRYKCAALELSQLNHNLSRLSPRRQSQYRIRRAKIPCVRLRYIFSSRKVEYHRKAKEKSYYIAAFASLPLSMEIGWQHTLIGSLEISPHANTARRIVVVLSPASLDNIWTDASVGAVLKQLSSLPTRVIVVTLKRLPSTTATIAKRSRRDRRDADNTSFDRLTILSWQDGGGGGSGGNGTTFGSGGRKFWYKLRLAMPAMRPVASEPACQSVAMIVQANGKCGQQKARSRESLEVLV